MKSTLNSLWKDWCWKWSSSTLATWCEELTHWKRPWCWEGLKAGEGDDRGWDSRLASPTHQLNGHKFEQILGNSEGKRNLAFCSPWGHKESETTEQLNWTELMPLFFHPPVSLSMYLISTSVSSPRLSCLSRCHSHAFSLIFSHFSFNVYSFQAL